MPMEDRQANENELAQVARSAQALQFTQLYFGPSAFSIAIASDTGQRGRCSSAHLPPDLALSKEQRPPSLSLRLLSSP